MPATLVRSVVTITLLGGIVVGLPATRALSARPQAVPGRAATARGSDLAAVEPIDTHVHAYIADPRVAELLDRFHLRVLNILLIDDRDPFAKGMEPQWSDALAVRAASSRAAVCTTIDPYGFEDAGFAARVNTRLNADFEAGAIAVKLYKTVGMEIKTKAGTYLMPDDPVFKPILDNIEAHHKSVVAHLAEPDSCWLPPDQASPDYSYYKEHPEEYAYRHPEWPSKQTILAARDHLLQMHPTLRVVGAHLGSMEVDVNQIAERFDRYPNFAVDTAARVPYLMRQSPEKVRAFLIKYQDRVIYGTDNVLMPNDKVETVLLDWASRYEGDWKYFSTGDEVHYDGGTTRGLRLPSAVLRKLYHDNAVRWIPGIE